MSYKLKIRLIQQLDQARAELQVDTQTEIYPPWKLKELLAHFIGWDEATSLDSRFRGNDGHSARSRPHLL